jgi:UDP-glucuronate decarboxylase
VTGGTGFRGSHLCERLLSEGYGVVCVDNLSTGTRENVAHLETDPGFEYVEHDVTLPFGSKAGSTRSITSPLRRARRTSSASP